MDIVDAAALSLVMLAGSQLVDEAVRPRPGGVGSVLGEPAGAKEQGLIARAQMSHPEPRRLAALAQAVARGELVIPIVARLPLERARAAQSMSEKGVGGRIVLRMH